MQTAKRQDRERRKTKALNLERAARGRVRASRKRLARNPTPEFLEELQAERQKNQDSLTKKLFEKHSRRLARFHLPEAVINEIMAQPISVRQKVIVRMNQTAMNNRYFGGK